MGIETKWDKMKATLCHSSHSFYNSNNSRQIKYLSYDNVFWGLPHPLVYTTLSTLLSLFQHYLKFVCASHKINYSKQYRLGLHTEYVTNISLGIENKTIYQRF